MCKTHRHTADINDKENVIQDPLNMTRVVAVETRIVWATTTQQTRNGGGGDIGGVHPFGISMPE